MWGTSGNAMRFSRNNAVVRGRFRHTGSMSDNGVPPYVPFQGGPTAAPQGSYNPAGPAVGSLDLPLYGAGPIVAVKRFYQSYAKFSGRASRSEFWWSSLMLFVAWFVLGGAGLALGYATGYTDSAGELQPGLAAFPFLIILFLLYLASIVPSIAISVRRLHDAGFSGLLYLITFVPYVGSFVLLIFFILPSKPEGARFDRINGMVPAYAQPYAPLPPQQYLQDQPNQYPPLPPQPYDRPQSDYPLQNRQTPPGF